MHPIGMRLGSAQYKRALDAWKTTEPAEAEPVEEYEPDHDAWSEWHDPED